MPRTISRLLLVAVLSPAADVALASQEVAPASIPTAALATSESVSTTRPQQPALNRGEGLVMLDYQVIPLPGAPSIDLMGLHFLNKLNDWAYLGVGGYAPVFKGDYGGFMAFDVTAQVQRKLWGNLFADAGLSMGGGGGGKSIEQSKALSGTGGFVKRHVGLGYEFKDFSIGANIAKMTFTKSAIDSAQLNVFVQVPFSHAIGSYASAGETYFSADTTGAPGNASEPGENTLTAGLDNFVQIKPEGANKSTIRVADLQYSHFLTRNSYGFFSLGVGYAGLPLYNEVLAGLGYRLPVLPKLNLYGQLALGSGGYAPDTIDTGPGLLAYPRVSAEYMFDKNLGASLSAGYLWAPKGSSRNYTFGASLNYHLHSGDGGSGSGQAAGGVLHRGYRFSAFQQTESDVRFRGKARGHLDLLSVQVDNVVGDHFYIPIEAAVAYKAYLGYPGYGELLAGLGVQNKYTQGDRLQLFGQLLAGTNVHGAIMKTGLGVNYGLSDRLAIYGLAGQTLGVNEDRFKSNYVGVGLTHRFSVPSW